MHIDIRKEKEMKETTTNKSIHQEYEEEIFPIWKRIEFNSSIPKEDQSFQNLNISFKEESNLSVRKIINPTHLNSMQLPQIPKEFKYGVSKKHILHNEFFSNTGTIIRVSDMTNIADPIYVLYKGDDENNLILDTNIIIIGKGSSAEIILDYRSEDSAVFRNGLTKIFLEANASLKLTRIQLFNKNSIFIDSCVNILDSGSSLKATHIELGSETMVTSHSTYLKDNRSSSDIKTIYMGTDYQKLDLGYSVYHYGEKTSSSLVAYGALNGNSKKVFRDNIYFKNGSKNAKGTEIESLILLSKEAHSDSIPALFCEEEDVQGTHAASAGQISENQLFYIMSRGLSEIEAKKLIVISSFEPVINEISNKEIKETIRSEIQQRFNNEL